jgi:hypothetical protein
MPILKKTTRKIQQPGIAESCLLPVTGGTGAFSAGILAIHVAGAAGAGIFIAGGNRTSELARGTRLANRSRT